MSTDLLMTERPSDETPWIRRGADQCGNAVWFWNDKPIRIDESGTKPMLCLKDGFEANGLEWGGMSMRSRLKDHLGITRFVTPGGRQSFATITPEGFNLLVMRSNKPFPEEFRRWLAGIASELGEKGYVDIRGPALMVPTVVPPSPLELLVQQASILHQTAIQLVEQGRRVEQLEARVEQIEQTRKEATKRILGLPAPTVPAPPRTDRHNIVEYVRGFCVATGSDFRASFGKLYREVRYRVGIDVEARMRNSPEKYESKVEILEEAGVLDKVYAIAREVLPWDSMATAQHGR